MHLARHIAEAMLYGNLHVEIGSLCGNFRYMLIGIEDFHLAWRLNICCSNHARTTRFERHGERLFAVHCKTYALEVEQEGNDIFTDAVNG